MTMHAYDRLRTADASALPPIATSELDSNTVIVIAAVDGTHYFRVKSIDYVFETLEKAVITANVMGYKAYRYAGYENKFYEQLMEDDNGSSE